MNKQDEAVSRFGAADIVYGSVFPSDEETAQSAFPAVSASKRLFDIGFSICALVFFAPVMLAIAGVLLLRGGGPIFFRHQRVGHAGKPFGCLKFRTMVVDADDRLHALLASDPAARAEWEVNHKLTNDPRVSCFGDFLRRSSLDELPQFFNVLRGEMSVVGPRPIVAAEIGKYRDNIAEYKSVRPGITGPWQVSGRSDTSYEERVALDTDYVRTQSLRGDMVIVLRTANAVLSTRGAR